MKHPPLLSDYAIEVMNRAARGELPKLPLELLAERRYVDGWMPGFSKEELEMISAALKLRDYQLLCIPNSSTGDVHVTSSGWEHVTCPRALAFRRLLEQREEKSDEWRRMR